MTLLALTPPGGPELLVILLIFVLLFGARKLPELGSSIGKSIKNFKHGVADAEADADGGTGDAGAPRETDGDSTTPVSREGQ